MSTTNTTSFSVSTDDIIAAALRQIGRLGAGASPTAEDKTNAQFALNLIVKNLAKNGYLIWTYKQASGAIPLSATTRTIGPSGANITAPRPVRIAQAWVRDSNNIDQPLTPLSRSDYNMLSQKTSTGKPVNFYYDAQVVNGASWNNQGTVYLWPAADLSTYTLYLSYQAPIQDVGATTTEFELPQEWFLALQWLLASELAMQYSVNLQKVNMIRAVAEQYLEEMSNFSREEASVYFTVDQQLGMGNGV